MRFAIAYSKKDLAGINILKEGIAKVLLGNRQGLTIIGPANVVKAIKKDPKKIELFTKESKKKKR